MSCLLSKLQPLIFKLSVLHIVRVCIQPLESDLACVYLCPGLTTWDWAVYVGACPWTKAVSAAREPVALHLGVGPCGFVLATLARQLLVLIMLDLLK